MASARDLADLGTLLKQERKAARKERRSAERSALMSEQSAAEKSLPNVPVERFADFFRPWREFTPPTADDLAAFRAAVQDVEPLRVAPRAVATPTDAGAVDEMAQRRHVGREQAEAAADRGDLEQVQHVEREETRRGEVEHFEDRAADREVARGTAVRDVERQVLLDGAEHGVGVRRVAIDVGYEDQYFVRLQRRVVVERREDLVADDLEFALRRVAVVHAQ